MPAISYKPRYAIADYMTWEGDWELWDGSPVAMSPSPSFRHQQIGCNLVATLSEQLRDNAACDDCYLAYEVDWHIDEHTVVRPDLLIVCGPEPEDFVTRPPAFVAEILSPSTAGKDRTAKRDLYALNNVSHYLIIDPDSRVVIHFTPAGSYGNGEEISAPVKLLLHGECSVTVDPAAVLA